MPKKTLILIIQIILICLLLGVLFLQAFFQEKTVIINNINPRLDINGNIIDAHDGGLIKFGKKFYLYGTSYGTGNGMSKNYFTVYSSYNLVDWKRHGQLIPNLKPNKRYRPHVVYNLKTKKYILFYNSYSGTSWNGRITAAISDSPIGPFTVQNSSINLKYKNPGDFNILVDQDNQAFISYTAISKDHQNYVEKLTPNYLNSTNKISKPVGPKGHEASIFFRRNNIYYLIISKNCCFCSNGSDAKVYTSYHALGPYEFQNNINLNSQGKIIIPAQQTFIAEIPNKNGIQYLWMADLWFSSPDGKKGEYKCGDKFPGTKAHDFQYWHLLEFDAFGNIKNLKKFINKFQIKINK
ncbi:hypothetical protein CL633_04110 [bacterium]|nr:hypothetical protein [bacterium]|tara:strand:+ start:1102 stop:2157 length:1056 start_codon:yes stop_codon:yes gene_type:complete